MEGAAWIPLAIAEIAGANSLCFASLTFLCGIELRMSFPLVIGKAGAAALERFLFGRAPPGMEVIKAE